MVLLSLSSFELTSAPKSFATDEPGIDLRVVDTVKMRLCSIDYEDIRSVNHWLTRHWTLCSVLASN